MDTTDSTTPNLEKLIHNINDNKIDMLILPNYSKLSGYVMSHVHSKFSNIIFGGSEGWGQGAWSFISGYPLDSKVIAYSVRSVYEKSASGGITVNSLDSYYHGKLLEPSQLALTTVRVLHQLTDLVCKVRPSDKKDLSSYLKKQQKNLFNKDTTIAIYKLKNNQMVYDIKYKDFNINRR